MERTYGRFAVKSGRRRKDQACDIVAIHSVQQVQACSKVHFVVPQRLSHGLTYSLTRGEKRVRSGESGKHDFSRFKHCVSHL